MKKVLLIVALVAISAVFIWRVGYLGTPSYGDWQSLELTEGRSFWPYVTCVDVRFNGMSVTMDFEVFESKWLDFDLWNGNRVDDIWIYAVTANGEFAIYPGPENPCQMSFKGGATSMIAGMMNMVSDDRFNPPAREVRLSFDLPPDSVTALRVVVIDGLGNTCEGMIPVSSIS